MAHNEIRITAEDIMDHILESESIDLDTLKVDIADDVRQSLVLDELVGADDLSAIERKVEDVEESIDDCANKAYADVESVRAELVEAQGRILRLEDTVQALLDGMTQSLVHVRALRSDA